MNMTWDEAVSTLTGPGCPFEITTQEVMGLPTKVYSRTPNSLRDLFMIARLYGDKPYLVYEDETWSYTDLVEHIDGLAHALVHNYGIQKGDRVAIAMRNYPEWIVAFAAITSIGGIAVALNAWWVSDEFEYGLKDSGSKLVIVDEERVKRVTPILKAANAAAIAIRVTGELPPEIDRYEDVVEMGAEMPEIGIDTDDDATILYTSGTTGFPKGAVSTHRAVLSALVGFACRAEIGKLTGSGGEVGAGEGDPAVILCVPLFHVTGLVPVMMGTFVSGSRLVMMHRWDPDRALELIEREKITTFVGVPTMSWELLESPDFARRDTSSLSSVSGGGAPAPPELVRRIEDGFDTARPGIGYGMTETNALGPQNSGNDYIAKPTSAGRASPSMDISVIDEKGNVLGPNERGEICFRGANLIRGYWGKPDETAEAISDGWLRSGDIGWLDEDGFIFVADRAKDMVLRAGENIYSAEVEAAIYEHPGVYEAAVYGVPHDRLGEEVATTVMVKAGQSIDAKELQDFLSERIAKFKVPTHMKFVTQQLPRNASGKILKRELREVMIEET
ncbi:MAG: class I adenylate-forming enzyme family protein [Actinomycetota bacterium]|nr:class I adenylate-forming enzyme family protein [Actinomycetota bacterium]